MLSHCVLHLCWYIGVFVSIIGILTSKKDNMTKIAIPKDLKKRLQAAVEVFWSTRKSQLEKQENLDVHDQGNRGAVTGGKQLDGFVDLISCTLEMNGVPKKDIYVRTNLELPGYYRPNKKWDLLVVYRKELLVAVEFKSQVGPSFGNNFNNRTEEAMGSALDIWTAYREGVFGSQKAPWLGYFMVLEDCVKSSVPVKVKSPHFHVLEEFEDSSYKERYEIFCNKLLLERQYSAVCLLTTSLRDNVSDYGFPNPALSCENFIRSMLGSILARIED